MQLNFMDVLSNLLGLFLLIAVGYAAVRLNILPISASPFFSKLLLKITLPCTIFTSLLRPYDPSFFKDVVIVIALGMVLFPINTLIARFLSRLLNIREGRRGVWSFCATFSNTGFMGFPIALALFGEEGLALAATLNITFNALSYTMGASMIIGDRPAVDGKGEKVNLRSVLITGINISTLLGLVFYFAQLSVPAAVLSPITHLGNITTPLSMMVTGINLAGGKFGKLFRDKDILTSTGARLVAIPLVTYVILMVLNMVLPFSNPLIMGVVFVIFCMPAPSVATILAETYGADQEYAAGIVFMTSLFCIATIPLMAILL